MSSERLNLLLQTESGLERSLNRARQAIAIERERIEVEARIAKDQQRLKELEEDPTGECARLAREETAKRQQKEQEEWERTRPAHWPYPSANMTEAEKSKYLEDRMM
jgi:hypothetical protein